MTVAGATRDAGVDGSDRAPDGDGPARPASAVHDLGYARYDGDRRARGTRWRVIARHQLATAWKTFWRYKLAVVLAVVVTCVGGGLLYVASDQLFRALGRGGLALTFADGVVPMSVTWYCKIGFLFSLTVGAVAVATDRQTGAFTFYVARSLRPRDYVLGRLAGLLALSAGIMLAGPLLLVALRLGLSDSPQALLALLPQVPRVLAVGAAGAVTYAVVPLGFSALVADRRHAAALWAAYYLVVGTIATRLAPAGGGLAALDLPTSLSSLSFELFGVHSLRGRAQVELGWALASLGGHAALGLALVGRQVSRAWRDGVGGGA